MDWSKAKNIILIGLIFTNIFLLSQYAMQYRNLMQGSEAISDYTINILSKNNITIDSDIPMEIAKMFPLTVSYSDLSEAEGQNLIAAAEVVKPDDRNKAGYRKAANKLLENNGWMNDNTKVERVTESDEQFTVEYGNYYAGIPLEESKMTLTYESGRLIDIKRHWLLVGLMSSVDTNQKTIVQDIKLVYYVMPYNSDMGILYDTAFPAWAIQYNGDQIKYISTIEQ